MNAPVTLDPRVGEKAEASFGVLRAAARGEIDASASVRKDRLRRLLALLDENTKTIADAISADFGHRSTHETRFAEAVVVEAGIKLALRRVDHWMSPRHIKTGLHFWPGSNRLLSQPLGVVGIISPWNFPLQLTLAPLVGALAAGNRVMIKPSELVPQFSALLTTAVSSRFDASELAVIEGGPAISQAFAALPFDHLLFTGSTRVGRLVAEVAARNLTPVTLELGGKSPAIIDRSADIALAARRIAFGKLVNAGQTCIAPDYVLCPRDAQDTFVEHYFKSVLRLYGTDPRNPDYTSIVNQAHYDRLENLLSDATFKGGRIDMRVEDISGWKALKKLPPCLVLSTTDEMQVRQEEIFGPILPVIPYDQADEAIAYVNSRDRPLALYWFGTAREARDRILRETISGGVTINDCLLHIAQEHQPFGGVGASGMGAYHGEWGFRTFSKEKPVFYRPRVSATALLQPPYGWIFERVLVLLRWLI
jgi:coniferyl-aldehyde dehydrogenase